MLHQLINRNTDLKQLYDESFEIEVKGAYLLVHSVPYVNSKREVRRGILVSSIELAGDQTVKPRDHTTHFIGEHPCDVEGNLIKGIQNASHDRDLGEGIVINHTFSNKPSSGYDNYHHKITTYINIISSHAEALESTATAKIFRDMEINEPDNPFNYIDTNSGRAEISAVSAKLKKLKVAIVGLGGTGSYVLDFVSKTPVAEIHLFDKDNLFSHNAFRSPGAPAIEKLREQPHKADYLYEIYSRMHRFIFPHNYNLTSSMLNQLSGMDFVFICIDTGEDKKAIIEKLVKDSIPFVDVGIGIYVINESLTGTARTTTATSQKNDHLPTRISYSNKGNDDYDKNIQIAEINALNAALAIIKWKKIFGFYHDLGNEYNCDYTINTNQLINDDSIS